MKVFVVITMGVGAMAAVDMQIDFPNFLRVRAEANLQTFTSALGGSAADPITSTTDPKRPFAVGDETFTDFRTAAIRTCNDQHNACAKIANEDGVPNPDGLKVSDCDEQQTDCQAAAAAGPSASATQAATVDSVSVAAEAEATLHSSDENFFYFCDP